MGRPSLITSVCVLVATLGCPWQRATTPPPDPQPEEETDTNPIIPAEPANKAEGDSDKGVMPLHNLSHHKSPRR